MLAVALAGCGVKEVPTEYPATIGEESPYESYADPSETYYADPSETYGDAPDKAEEQFYEYKINEYFHFSEGLAWVVTTTSTLSMLLLIKQGGYCIPQTRS
jgi:hypothetical protein